jgi:hypothetical protein
MPHQMYNPSVLETYYIVYGVLCAALIVWLIKTLHRAGNIFLQDSFPGRPELAMAVRRLLDIGFYLVCFGYVALTFKTFWPMTDLSEATEVLSVKLGCFLLLLGGMHFFNLLLLAIFRRRGPAATLPAAS